ncbi:MAG: hypothetical protein ACYTEX_11005 [Planctomycetota bacterium]
MSDLENARECYFAAGGQESDIGPRDNPEWYWRRAAKAWRDKAEIARRVFVLPEVALALSRVVHDYPQTRDRKRAAWAMIEGRISTGESDGE